MIAVGVDTHKHWHVAVALDALGQLVGEITVAATRFGLPESGHVAGAAGERGGGRDRARRQLRRWLVSTS
jgi:hypothetical protein